MKERKTDRNVAEDSGERVNDNGLLFLGRVRAGGDLQRGMVSVCRSLKMYIHVSH